MRPAISDVAVTYVHVDIASIQGGARCSGGASDHGLAIGGGGGGRLILR